MLIPMLYISNGRPVPLQSNFLNKVRLRLSQRFKISTRRPYVLQFLPQAGKLFEHGFSFILSQEASPELLTYSGDRIAWIAIHSPACVPDNQPNDPSFNWINFPIITHLAGTMGYLILGLQEVLGSGRTPKAPL